MQHVFETGTQRAAAVLTSATNLDVRLPQGGAGIQWEFTVASRTAGSVAVTFYGSVDGTTWVSYPTTWNMSFSANNVYDSEIGKLAPAVLLPYMRATLTPSSFDGTLAATLRCTQGPVIPV